MKGKVARLTDCLMQEGGGDPKETAQIYANFESQLVVQPFVDLERTKRTPQHRFGANALDTMAKAKEKSNKAGCPADMFRRAVLASGAHGPLSDKHEVSMAELARLGGYNDRRRVRKLFKAKKSSKTLDDLLSNDAVAGVFKSRKDKLAGNPIWTQAWHNFMAFKKGQSFRCQIVNTKRVKVGKRWLWETKWERHQKRYMSMKMSEFHAQVLKWEPYLQWRAIYLAKNPRLPSDWHVGEKRLYKEKCFCIDRQESVRKCGCEIHLKMGELIAALLHWRRRKKAAVLRVQPSHTCLVSQHNNIHMYFFTFS